MLNNTPNISVQGFSIYPFIFGDSQVTIFEFIIERYCILYLICIAVYPLFCRLCILSRGSPNKEGTYLFASWLSEVVTLNSPQTLQSHDKVATCKIAVMCNNNE